MSLDRAILTDGQRRGLWRVAFLGAVGLGVAFWLAPTRAWAAYLSTAWYFTTLSLGAMALMALNNVAKASWTVAIKRVAEGFGGYLPLGALSMLLVLPGAYVVYDHWLGEHAAHDAIIHSRGNWQTLPFFAVRMAVILAIWVAFVWALRNESQKQDEDRSLAHTHRTVTLSALFLVCGSLTFCLAAFDWIMSINPHWQSTIFGFYNIAGMLSASTSALAIATVLLRRRGLLPFVTEHHLGSLGQLMFGFSTLWAYMWLSQYLLIWYANMPEETAHYITRFEGGWQLPFWLNLIVGWALPFLFLLPATAKRSEFRLLAVGCMLLGARFLDIYLMVAPDQMTEHVGLGWPEVCAFFGVAAIFVLMVERAIRRAPLLAKHDPYLEESLHSH